jgi:hypothetical protein
VIHQLKFIHANETFVFRFTADRIGQLRQTLAEFWQRGMLPLEVIFEASRTAGKVLERPTDMDEIEKLRCEWLKVGCNVQINATADGWEVRLWNTVMRRPPQGRGATLLEACAEAELDRIQLMKSVKQSA